MLTPRSLTSPQSTLGSVRIIAVFTAVMALVLAFMVTPARADGLSSLALVDGNATGGNVSLNASATPFLFTGIANAADDTININAVFASGTTTATVALGAASPSTPVTVTSGVNTPVPISSGMNEIAVTHTDGPTTTTYTLRITRSWPISGYEIINADDSTVLASKTGAGFDPADQDDTLVVGHATDRIRVRMFYTDPTEATALPTNATIWWGCGVGCQGPATVTSGEWSNPITLRVGAQTLGLYASIPNGGTSWNIRTTRAAAFTPDTVSALTLVDGNATGESVALNASATPFLFTGIANAADDTININAVFASGSTTATVAFGSASPSAPITVLSAVNTPVPISAGMNEIVVTHTDGPTTTTYTLRFVRSWPISGYEIINADDSTVLASKTGAAFNPADQDDTLVVGHATDRIRVRMFYTDPTEPSALPTNATIWWGCGVGCSGPATVTSGEWTAPITLNVGAQTLGLYASITNWYPYEGTRWNIRTTRASAFAAITSVTLPGVPAAGTPVPAGSAISVTPSGVTGEPTPTVTYDWEAADDTTFTTTTVVATTTTPSWTPDNSVADKFVRVTATADNGISTPTTVTSSAFGPIAAVNAAPTITSATITGTAQVGVTLSAGVTGLTGYPAPTVTYQWESAPDGSSPFTVVGTGATYTLSSADLGSLIRVVATADNGIGSAAVATSSATAAVITGSGSGGSSDAPAAPVPPDVPSNVQVIAGDESVTVSWDAPANTGAFPVSTYQVMTEEGSEQCLTEDTICVIDGLTNGSEYSFRVRALSGSGWSNWSAASQVAVPGTPSIMITGTRAEVRGRPGIIVSGVAQGLAPGSIVYPWFKLPGHNSYREGISRISIDESGELTWQRRTGKKIYISLRSADGQPLSNRLIMGSR